jgi:ABC-2 type transport system ATP-binding protein
VLILDEPASGLDPRARIEMRELLRELQNMGKTIFFSSHILSEVADICTSIGIIEAGRLIAHGDMEEMKRRLRAHRLIQIRVLGDSAPLVEVLQGEAAVQAITASGDTGIPAGAVRIDFSGDDAALSELLGRLVAAGISIVTFGEETGDLEDIFLHVTQGIVS